MDERYSIGVDIARKSHWWQRLLVWLGVKNRWTDRSCAVIVKHNKDGSMEVVDIKHD